MIAASGSQGWYRTLGTGKSLWFGLLPRLEAVDGAPRLQARPTL